MRNRVTAFCIGLRIGLCGALLLFSLPAKAGYIGVSSDASAKAVDGSAILAEIDRRADAFKDQSHTATMTIYRNDKQWKTMVFEMVLKGLDRQYIHFVSPGGVAGMKVMMSDADTMWLYSPEFKKVRKIAAHTKNQGFLGSDFSPEDMGLSRLSNRFEARLKSKSGSETTIELFPKKGVQFSFASLEMVIDSSVGGVTIIRYLNAAKKVLREQHRESWKKIEGNAMPTKIVMKNLTGRTYTVIELAKIRVNTGVADSFFSRRTLLRK